MTADKYHNEVLLLLRYACERAARGLFIQASASRIRIMARRMERAALGAALTDCEASAAEKAGVKP